MREQQQRFMELTEQERRAQMEKRAKRLAITNDLMRTYEYEKQVEHFITYSDSPLHEA